MKKRCFYLILLTILVGFLSSCERKARPLPNIDIVSETIPWGDKIPCVIVYSENGDIWMENGRVKCHGGASCVFPKVSYTFEEETEVMRKYLDIRIPQLDEEMGYKSR